MCAQRQRIGHPYQLEGSRLVFTDWYYIQPGSFSWHDQQGNNVTVFGGQEPDEAYIKRHNHPWGIQLKVNEGIRSGPIFPRDEEWEQEGFVINTIMQDDGKYKAWGSTSWQSSFPEKGNRFLLYYESNDGVNWVRPDCGVVAYKGNTHTNILFDGRVTPGIQHGGSVFIDPTSKEERYKMLCETRFTAEECERYIAERPDAIEGIANTKGKHYPGIQGAVSPDGIHWTVLPDPLVISIADTQTVGYYDAYLKKYVIYSRDWVAKSQAPGMTGLENTWFNSGRRAINRAESDNFRKFPLPELVIEPLPLMKPYEVFYANARTTIPGAPGQHIMFPTVWTMGSTDNKHVLMYSSQNGKNWSPVSLDPVMRTAPFGEWDGGALFYVTPNLLELANGDFALAYTGWNVPHKYPRDNARRSVGYAVWPKGRLVGVHAAERGEFTTAAILAPGSKLFINAVTERTGSIRVEACYMNGEPIKGRELVNAIPIVGDAYKQPVRWKEADSLGVEPGQPVMLRLHMEMSTVYALDFE
jgi:hypothetical protein